MNAPIGRAPRRVLVCVVLTLLGSIAAALGTWGVASAHAELVSTSPTSNAVLTDSPTQIVLTFSEHVDPVPDSIRLVAGDGTAVEIGSMSQTQGDSTISTSVPALATGTYVVAWRAISADSHPVAGAFTFSVGAPSTTDPNLVTSLINSNEPGRPAEAWLAVGRWASYLGIAVLLGAIWVLAGVWSAGLRARRATLLLAVAGGVAIAGTILMIAAQASVNVGSATSWGEVIRTQSGRWWLVRLIVVAVALAVVLARRSLRRNTFSLTVSWLGGLGLLAVVAAGGHAVSGRWVTIGLAATIGHLAALAIWIGGLAGIAVVVPRDRLTRAATSFSPLALGAVVVLASTGTINAWRQSGSWGDLVHSSYGAWLIVKLVLVAAVLAIAAASRWTVRQATTEHTPRVLRRTVTAEVIGIFVVMIATAGLTNSPPPRAAALAPASATVVQGSRIAQIDLAPAVTGGTQMHVYLSDTTGSLKVPTSITVTASLPLQNIGPLDLPTVPSGPGHVVGNDTVLPLAGTWTFSITARYSEFDQTVFSATVKVR
ncbi:MAG: copper resistance protein CopC [Ilumatobacteraceae bacterium]